MVKKVVDQILPTTVLDYANRNMAGVESLRNLPTDKSIQIGVLDISGGPPGHVGPSAHFSDEGICSTC